MYLKYTFIKLVKIITICTLLFSLVSCFLKRNENEIDISNAFKISTLESWGVIVDSYASFREEPNIDSHIVSHCRKGDVHKIIGNHIVLDNNKRVLWYQFEDGWLQESTVQIFSNKIQAEKNALSVLKQ